MLTNAPKYRDTQYLQPGDRQRSIRIIWWAQLRMGKG